jgi:NADH-quinone oxidoreductase subunit G
MLAADLSAYILLEVYPQYDFHDFVQAIESLDRFVVILIALSSTLY